MEEIKDKYNLKSEEHNYVMGNALKNLNLLKAVQKEAEFNKVKLV